MATNQKYQSSKMDDESYNARVQDWNLLKVFHVIAQHNGLTRAAEALSRNSLRSPLRFVAWKIGLV